MDKPSGAMFFDLDIQTGQLVPADYESIRSALLRDTPSLESMPEEIRQLLLVAVDYFALACEQANNGRVHLYVPLANDAFLKTVLALELALHHRLRRGKNATLYELIQDRISEGLLPSTGGYELVWHEVRKSRNQITHAASGFPSYGPLAGSLIKGLVHVISRLSPSEERLGATPGDNRLPLGVPSSPRHPAAK